MTSGLSIPPLAGVEGAAPRLKGSRGRACILRIIACDLQRLSLWISVDKAHALYGRSGSPAALPHRACRTRRILAAFFPTAISKPSTVRITASSEGFVPRVGSFGAFPTARRERAAHVVVC